MYKNFGYIHLDISDHRGKRVNTTSFFNFIVEVFRYIPFDTFFKISFHCLLSEGGGKPICPRQGHLYRGSGPFCLFVSGLSNYGLKHFSFFL